jgi:uncharacterized protein (TIGR03083 family)
MATDKHPRDQVDEVAALLALDALDPSEQADAELRYGSFPRELEDVTLPLAESVATAPPQDLKHQVLASARSRRRPGRPIRSPEPISPAEAFARTIEDLRALLASLTPQEWDVVAHEEHGRVRDLTAHLAGVERLNQRWLDPDDEVPSLPDHVASTRDVVAALADEDPTEVLHQWHDSALAMLAAASAYDSDRVIPFHDIVVSVAGLLTTRTFELWAHGMDIALAAGRPMPMLDEARMLLMSSRLMAALPWALAYRGVPPLQRTARFVLTGPAGGCYDVLLDPSPPGDLRSTDTEADVTIVADVVDLCRVAAARMSHDDLSRDVTGDLPLAELVLANVAAFARD